MRAYIYIDDKTDTHDALFFMKKYLSFDSDEPFETKKKKNGQMLLYQDIPMRCEKCGRQDDSVVYHHYFGRRYKALVDDPENRIPLCGECHNISSEFSAHLTPQKFTDWICEKRGYDWLVSLQQKKLCK